MAGVRSADEPVVVLLGAPGAGKGTLAPVLARALGVPHLSTGDLLRRHVSENTPLGREAKAFMDGGELVPDDLVTAMMREELATGGALLDGYPRNLSQAEALDGMLEERGGCVRRALLVEVPDDELVRRLSARRSCPKCGAVYNLVTKKPARRDRCDACGERLIARDDDAPETVRRRLRVYERRTELLVGYYRKRGVLRAFDGVGTPSAVAERALDLL